MAAVVNSYPVSLYHPHINRVVTPYYNAQYISSNYYKTKPQKPQPKRARTSSPKKVLEHTDSKIQHVRPRRQPRIHRQVIVLPTPEPIYRQIRHRLPTPERQVIRRTFLQRANGDVIVQQERQRKRTRSKITTYPLVAK
ncbi:hypothetical protein I4U23_008636 [Adineta vaga]|nr:hypothetical protein I4U23_008636 [Adineta vaga]